MIEIYIVYHHFGEKKYRDMSLGSYRPALDDKDKLIVFPFFFSVSYQLRCDELESHNKDLMTQHSALQSEKMDVVDYLKHSLAEKEAEADELSERLQHQHQTTQQNTESLQLQHSQLTQQLQDTINTLTLENTSLVERLNSLKEFQEQKETLMTRIEFLEKRLSCQKEEHRDDIHSLEIKALMEKRSQQKEMENHVASMEAEVQLQVHQKVPQTTKVTLQENVELKTRMNQLSQHVQVLTGENESLREQKSHLSLSVDILEQTLRETSRTSCVRKKVVEHLTEKCQKLQAEQKQWQQQLHQLQSERSSLSTEMKKIRSETFPFVFGTLKK
uniref:Cilia- and flagella-associated protein 157 n=1 Tax=Gouania willdenowi TaxID=441366 RepID=A0A8C5GX92_GOUWI